MRYFWPLLLGFGCALVMGSCSSGDDGDGSGDDGDDQNGSGGWYTGLGGAAAVSLGGYTSSSGGGSADAPGRSDAPCTEVEYEARVTPINLIFVWDKSGSMGAGNGWDNTETRWNPVRDGLGAFLADPGSSDLQASLKFFPVDGNLDEACDIDNYVTPDVPLMPLQESNTVFIEAINATTPAGGTPTYPALQGAAIYARQVWEQNRDQISVIVLVTDGQPEFQLDDGTMGPGCENNTIAGVTDAARDAYQGNPRIPVYVFGIGPDLLSLHSIASAGGTGLATILSDTDPEATRDLFLTTLEQIRAEYIACNLRIPEVPVGEPALDFDEINVNFITGAGELQELHYDANCAQGTGWQYPGDNRVDPGWIELCPDLCATVQTDAEAELEIQVGCVTRSIY